MAKSDVKIEHFAKEVPKDLPPLDDIARLCETAGYYDGNGLCIHMRHPPRTYWWRNHRPRLLH
ncbi:hypothetical protein K443DRAFT_610362 [Laccaria amethystina LaAM-08-1]|uniref:Uncharacterized protein n=1 Tax=Laccaria amethystina LaAM-08-1 TaxID=1095629 RepID=A0A0C9Y2M2_9AGAR|nr:hypothetical protein K443DRAFT_610362 [Laccaria amethystina LaAM-08-1]